MPGPESNSLDEHQFTVPNAHGKPLIHARRNADLVDVTVMTRKPGEPAQIAPADARDLGAALTYLAHVAEHGGDTPGEPGGPRELTIADEAKVSAWGDAAELIRAVLERQTDLDAFHVLERGPDHAWMTQALAVIACDLLGELTEAQARLNRFSKKDTPREILAERVDLIRWQQMRRADQRAGGQ